MLLEDSTTYQEILERGVKQGISQGLQQGINQGIHKGIHQGQLQLLLGLGKKRFGQPSEAVISRLAAITDPDLFERLAERLLEVDSWEKLLAEI